MLKVISHQNIILLIFSGLLLDVLTPVTLSAVAVGIALSFLQIRPPKWPRNIVAVGVFVSYFITYGKVIDPEIGLNFLTSIIILKMLEREDDRDHYMIFFGLILLIAAGSLFEKSLTYIAFFSISFLILVRDFYEFLEIKWKFKDLGLAMLWVAPLTFSLFFLAPRLLNPIPFNASSQRMGEVGYTTNVNLSDLESLGSNASPVFQVQIEETLSQHQLYWRGNTLTLTDGWNWNLSPRDEASGKYVNPVEYSPSPIKQTFRIFTKTDFYFALDYPLSYQFENKTYLPSKARSLKQPRWNWTAKYQALSIPGQSVSDDEIERENQLAPIRPATKKWITKNFSGTNLREIQREVRQYFLKNKFSYSLSPGKSSSFEDFMFQKKIGLCSHFASATALILRAKGFPARLVSGFMGGQYNRFADFYLITQNDAHVWVEVHHDGQWIKVDPTDWIAPDRVLLGGEEFMQNVFNGTYQKERFFRMPEFYQDLRQWFRQWDFKFYLWLEEIDYHAQEAWLTRFQLKRQWLYYIIPLIVLGFVGLYYLWSMLRQRARIVLSESELAWLELQQKLKKQGIQISLQSLGHDKRQIQFSNTRKKDDLLNIWQELVELSFQNKGMKSIRRKIKKL